MNRIYLCCHCACAGLFIRMCLFIQASELGQYAIRNRYPIALFHCWLCFLSEGLRRTVVHVYRYLVNLVLGVATFFNFMPDICTARSTCNR